VRVVRCGAGHPAVARNRAARAARGAWLAFLDDDDRWDPDHLAGFGTALGHGATVLYRDAAVIRERIAGDGRRIESARRVIAREWDAALMRTDDYIPPSSVVIERALFEQLGGFDEGMRYSEDWDLLLRAARFAPPRRVSGVTVEVRLRERGNLSSDEGPERRACLRVLATRHGLPPLVMRTFWEVAAIVSGERAR
jgi:O-antigen biosynthesis protein